MQVQKYIFLLDKLSMSQDSSYEIIHANYYLFKEHGEIMNIKIKFLSKLYF